MVWTCRAQHRLDCRSTQAKCGCTEKIWQAKEIMGWSAWKWQKEARYGFCWPSKSFWVERTPSRKTCQKAQPSVEENRALKWIWYDDDDDDPSSSGSSIILFTRLLYYTICQSRKREIIQPNIFRILPKVDQVIYILDTICMPNSMILAHWVLLIFCSRGLLWVKCLSLKRGIIQSNIHRIRSSTPWTPSICQILWPG